MVSEEKEEEKKSKDKTTTLAPDSNRKYKLKFNVKGYKANCRVHVYGLTFLPNNNLGHFKQNERITANNITLDIFRFAKWTNAYLSNRKLGDEYRYVFERRFMERFIGNTLDRPQLLLKRNKIRETQFDQESLSSGGNYARQEADRYGGFDIQVQQQQPMGYANYDY